LNDTACFIYWLKGENKLYTHNNRINNSSKVALLLKSGMGGVAGPELVAAVSNAD
jgi:hypothetical protein